MTFAALGQVRADDQLRMARSLGYGPVQAWLKVVLPQVYPQIRLPVYAVLAYSLSVVDMAIVLGPTTPPPLAPLVLRWFNDPDLAMRFLAAAGARAAVRCVVALAIAALARRSSRCSAGSRAPGSRPAARRRKWRARAGRPRPACCCCSALRSAACSRSLSGRSPGAGATPRPGRRRCRSALGGAARHAGAARP